MASWLAWHLLIVLIAVAHAHLLIPLSWGSILTLLLDIEGCGTIPARLDIYSSGLYSPNGPPDRSEEFREDGQALLPTEQHHATRTQPCVNLTGLWKTFAIRMAVAEKLAEQRRGIAFGRCTRDQFKAWWAAYTQELCGRDPALTNAQLTAKRHAHYNLIHTHAMTCKVRSCMRNPHMQFPHYFATLENLPDSRPLHLRPQIRVAADQFFVAY